MYDPNLIDRDIAAINWAFAQGKFLTVSAAKKSLLALYQDHTHNFTRTITDDLRLVVWKQWRDRVNQLSIIDADLLEAA
jgi:hypothetical protein